MNTYEEKFKKEKIDARPVCIIPARMGSKRLKNKNKLRLGGKSLVEHAILTALESKLFQVIVVSSDDEEILEIAYNHFNHGLVQPSKRPERMSADDILVREVCLHALICYRTQATEFCLLQPNSPFRTARDLQKAYKAFRKSGANYLITVKPYKEPPQLALKIEDGFLTPNWGHESIKQSQDLEQLYYEDGAITFAKINVFSSELKLNFHGANCMPYILPHPTMEIHTKKDLKKARELWKRS